MEDLFLILIILFLGVIVVNLLKQPTAYPVYVSRGPMRPHYRHHGHHGHNRHHRHHRHHRQHRSP